MIASVVGNLSLLCYFKYANFFLDSLEAALIAGGASASLPVLKVILPIGISFYTFEAISYTVDVYLQRIRAERSLPNFMLFILFFPHLVAGPIVRSRDFLPQIPKRKRWNWTRMQIGVQYFLMGLVKKLVIADRMAYFSDPVFADPGAFETKAVWIAVVAYALQIYCDFSGYSDMALGSAQMLGFSLKKNFDLPYIAANVSEFWRRWHISLSSWIRDYLYIPLGGSRGRRWQIWRNLLLTMGLAGLWHGAGWNFIAFGVLHGVLLIVHREYSQWHAARPKLSRMLQSPPLRALAMLMTFVAVCVGWVFFRAQSFHEAQLVFGRMFVPSSGQGTPLHSNGFYFTLIFVIVCHVLAWNDRWKQLFDRVPSPMLGLGYAAAMCFALLLSPPASKAFIYFQF
jgi:alginate O-acetyltransferase complex protein AlgI